MSMPIGVGVVVDDQLGSSTDGIGNIIGQLEMRGFPLVKYNQLPPDGTITQFGSVAFLLLDWNLTNPPESDMESGVQTGSTLQAGSTEDVLEFLEKFHRACFAPVFIFTNESTETIKETLKARKMFFDDERDYILLKSKTELLSSASQKDVVQSVAGEWVAKTPVFHLVDAWNRGVFKAQSEMLNDFYEGSHKWPRLLWKTFKEDGADPQSELISLVSKNLFSRLNILLDEATMESASASNDEVGEAMSFIAKAIAIPSRSLEQRHGSGDVFIRESQPEEGNRAEANDQYLLNISCDCDFARNPNARVLFLVGRVVPINKATDSNGTLKRSLSKAYVYPFEGNKCVCFEFAHHVVVELSKLDISKRVCRIAPPYLTDIRQRYGHWIQREGLPAMPKISRN